VAWALYIFLEPISKSISLLAAWFRLVYSIIFGIALVNYFNIFNLLGSFEYLKVIELDHLHAGVLLSISAFRDTWAIGFIFFGLHLMLAGYLAIKSDYIPKIIAVLLIIAGFGWLIEYFGKFLFPRFDVPVGQVLGLGEAFFMLWLILKGNKVQPN
jgi:hypothetical protein